MIPISLTFEGLYSYQERQTIDFQALTSVGLFGIFGATGSGKSSILEAISFALYGETERLGQKENRAYNMMNLYKNQLFIQLDFLNYEEKKYRVERLYKRNSKHFEEVKLSKTMFYEQINGQWTPLAHTNSESIVGMSYQNFKRTIIIPQGQFREFLELGAKDRTLMLMEIFHLQKYDLSGKISALKNQAQNDYQLLLGQLQVYDSYELELLPAQEAALLQQQSLLQQLTIQLAQLTEAFDAQKQLKADFFSLQHYTQKLQEAQAKAPEMELLVQQAQTYKRTKQAFAHLIEKKNEQAQALLHSSQYICELQGARGKEQEEYEKIIPQWEAVQKQYAGISQQKERLKDNELLQKIISLHQQAQQYKERISKGQAVIAHTQTQYSELIAKIDALHAQQKHLHAQLLPTEKIIAVEQWYSTQAHLVAQKEQLFTQKEQLTAQKEALLRTYAQGLEQHKDKLALEQAQCKQAIKQIEELTSTCKLHQALFEYATQLQEGEPCPVCGSQQHPKEQHYQNQAPQLSALGQQMEQKQKQLQEIEQQLVTIAKTSVQVAALEIQITALHAQIATQEKSVATHREAFVWQEYDPSSKTTFLQSKVTHQSTAQAIEGITQQVQELTEQVQQISAQKEKYAEGLQSITASLHQVQGQLQGAQEQLLHHSKDEPWAYSQEELIAEHQKISLHIRQTEQAFEKIQTRITALREYIAQLLAREQEAQKQQQYHLMLQAQVQEMIKDCLSKNGFADLSQVEQILLTAINVEEVEAQAQAFALALKEVEASVILYQSKVKDYTYNEALFLQYEQDLHSAKEKHALCSKEVVQLEQTIARKQKQKQERASLQEQQLLLQARMEYISTIFNLLKGNGFVNYISSVYLKELCYNANQRFEQMTRNTLSLAVDADNEIVIKDNLSNGKVRSIKTLSGGQLFQASLAMALALSGSVQALSKASQRFFFIDEGFGTQDEESVQIVFDTLMSLVKENRIVGIISHLPTLKERIPLSLSISQHKEKGSQISFSAQ